MSESNGFPQDESLDPAGVDEPAGDQGSDPTVAEAAGLPRRVDAGDGQGDYVYTKRGPFGRVRARFQALGQFWLDTAVPRDRDSPPQPGSPTSVLAGTWPRKLVTLVVALALGFLLAALVLIGL